MKYQGNDQQLDPRHWLLRGVAARKEEIIGVSKKYKTCDLPSESVIKSNITMEHHHA